MNAQTFGQGLQVLHLASAAALAFEKVFVHANVAIVILQASRQQQQDIPGGIPLVHEAVSDGIHQKKDLV